MPQNERLKLQNPDPDKPNNPPDTEIEPAKSPHIDIPQPDAPSGPVITPTEPTVPVRGLARD